MKQGKDWEAEIADMNSVPYVKLLGMKVVELAEGYARVTIPVDQRLDSRNQALHGGVLSSLADTAIAMAVFTVIKPAQTPVTIELNINYLKPLQGPQAIAEARIISKGRTIVVGDIDITDNTGRMIAKSRATYAVLG